MKFFTYVAVVSVVFGSFAHIAQASTPGGSDYSIQYNLSNAFAGDSNLTWNPIDSLLGLSGSQVTMKVVNQTATNTSGTPFSIFGSNGKGTGNGGDVELWAGRADFGTDPSGRGGDLTLSAGNTNRGNRGGDIYVLAGEGNGGEYDGGSVYIGSRTAGPEGGVGGSIVMSNYQGTSADLNSGSIDMIVGTGFLRIKHLVSGAWGIFNPSGLTADRTYKLPDASGTLAISEEVMVQTATDYSVPPNEAITLVGVTDTTLPVTITIPECSSTNEGRVYTIKDESGGAATNNITVQPDISGGIEGQAQYLITQDFGAVELYCSKTPGVWFVKSKI